MDVINSICGYENITSVNKVFVSKFLEASFKEMGLSHPTQLKQSKASIYIIENTYPFSKY